MSESILPLVVHPSPKLRQVSAGIEKFDKDIRNKFLQLEAALKHYEGYGIAGVQVGIMLRMFAIDWDLLLEGMQRLGHPTTLQPIGKTVFIGNPEILEISAEKLKVTDACLSLPGIYADVSRANHIKIKYYDIDGAKQVIEATGLMAFCLQHEIDHLNGKLFYDHLSALKRSMLIKKMEKFIANLKRTQ
jgi:peptide deformylase